MTTSVLFEAGTIIDIIQRAEKAAPKVDTSTERFSGLVMDIQPSGGYCVIRTTNEIVYYREVVDFLEVSSPDRTTWRLPSEMLSKMIATFSARSGETILFSQNGGMVELTQNRKKARISTIAMGHYPNWYALDSDDLSQVEDLGSKIKWIEWATDAELTALGIRITPDALYGTDRYVLARAPLKIERMGEPVTIPPGSLAGLVPLRGNVGLKVVGNQILLMPSESIQILVLTIGAQFPPVLKAMRNEYPCQFRVAKDEILNLVKSANTVKVKNLTCILRLFIGNGIVGGVAQAEDQEDGIRDIIDVAGAENTEVYEAYVNPLFLGNALSNCPDDFVTVKYDNKKLSVILIEGSSGYQVWVTPIDPKKVKSARVNA